MKLLQYQHDLAFEINDKYDVNKQKIIGSSLLLIMGKGWTNLKVRRERGGGFSHLLG